MVVAVVWLSLIHYYTAITGFLAYTLVIFKKIKISNSDLIFLFGLLFLIVLHCFTGGLFGTILDCRYYWGWLIFYFIFKANIVSYKELNFTLAALSVMTLVEALLVNTVITTSMLPNFIDTINDGGGSLAIFSVYQRPFSFGGIAPVGAPLLVALMVLCNVNGWRLLLSALAVLSLGSGTGTFLLLFLLLFKYRSRLLVLFPALFMIIFPWLLWFSDQIISFARMLTEKISLDYVVFMFELLWLITVSVVEKLELYMVLIGFPPGHEEVSGHGGDWGILSFISMNGILGLFLLLMMLFSRMNKINKLPLLIILIASIHYSAMSSLPGQMLFGLLLSIDKFGLPDGNEVPS